MEEVLFESAVDPAAADVAAVDAGLHTYNTRAADLDAVRRFGCYARLASGQIVGGALARWWGTACELQQLWVQESYRRRGIGSGLIQLVECCAVDQGCDLIYLDTFTWQAPQLYRKLGYEVACELRGFPDGASKLVMRKSLAAN